MPVDVKVKAPKELTELLDKLKGVDTRLAKGVALQTFSPYLVRALVENSGSSGNFARGWIGGVSLIPDGRGLIVRNTFGKAKFVEQPTKAHMIYPRRGGGAHRVPIKAKKRKVTKLQSAKFAAHREATLRKIKEQNETRGSFKSFVSKVAGAIKKGTGVLAWRANGKGAFSAFKVNAGTKASAFIYAKSVAHPGTKGKFAFAKTIKQQSGLLFSLLTDELKKSLGG